MYATSSLHPPSRILSTQGVTCQKVSDPSSSFDQAAALGSNFPLDFTETLYGSNASNNHLEEANEGSKKKKVSADGISFYLFAQR